MTKLAEIEEIERLIANLQGLVRSEVIAHSHDAGEDLPLYKLSFGSTDPTAPTLGLIGGVHGLERIGAQVCLSLLSSLSQLVLWDSHTLKLLENVRIFFIPTVNPWGMHRKRRANPRGVDLMRNSPVIGTKDITPIVGGQRYSPKLPWYRGPEGGEMEVESSAVVRAVEAEIANSRMAMTIDFHSGFGLVDRIWFPYAKTKDPFPDLALAHSFKELMEKTYPHHVYQIEPQSISYTTHGDLWDYIYDRHISRLNTPYLPLCLEMGSWSWVKKNPFQFFTSDGAFNPVKRHRLRRTLRRHNLFFEFLLRALNSPEAWALLNEEQRAKHTSRGMRLWYGD